jgi:hypothetical protein
MNLNYQQILEDAPATVGGYSGFSLHYTYRFQDLKFEGLFYGAWVGARLYYVLYEAPTQGYFAKDFEVFNRTRSSFQIRKEASTMNSKSRWPGFHAVLSIYLSIALTNGCATHSMGTRPSPAEEQEALRQKTQTVVLLRLPATLDNKEVHPLAEDRRVLPIHFELANVDTAEPVRKVTPSALTDETARSGWAAITLEPGTYFLHLELGGTDQPISPVSKFRFIVPRDTPVLYVGTLHLECISKEVRTLWGTRREAVDYCFSDAPVGEIEKAITVADAAFPRVRAPVVSLMQPYGVSLPFGTLLNLSPVALSRVQLQAELGAPDWMERAMTAGLAPSMLFIGLGAVGGLQGAAAGAGLAILWAPVGIVLGYLGGKWSAASFEGCRKIIEQSVIEFDTTDQLQNRLAGRLEQWRVQTAELRGQVANEAKSILELQLHRVALNECGYGSEEFCVEVATRVRLFDVATTTYLYDSVLLSTNSALHARPYELVVREPEPVSAEIETQWTGLELAAYCSSDGAEIMRGELSRAVDITVSRVVKDLGLRFEESSPGTED